MKKTIKIVGDQVVVADKNGKARAWLRDLARVVRGADVVFPLHGGMNVEEWGYGRWNLRTRPWVSGSFGAQIGCMKFNLREVRAIAAAILRRGL